MKKKYLFQYASKHDIYEDTDLITKDEAYALRDKWLDHMKERWDEFESPQMVIWSGCESNTDYNTEEFEVDFRDCILENGHFYRVEKKKLT